MKIKIGIAPIAWSNDDMPELGGDTPIEVCLDEAKKAGFSGIELGGKFPRNPGIINFLLNKFQLKMPGGWYGAQLRNRSINEEWSAMQDHLDLLKIVKGDITDYQLLEKTIQDHQITHIVHTAYYFTFASQKDPLTACKVSNLGTSNIFEIARKNDLKRVVWASSNAVFGHAKLYDKQPVTEEAPLWPMTVYGACKLFNEHMGQHYFDQFGLSNIGLRFSGVYGYGMARRKTSASNFLFDLFETG